MVVTLVPILQDSIINVALTGAYEALTWRQFGAVNPDLNYIFWTPTNASTPGFAINMARNTDPAMQTALLQGRQSTDKVDAGRRLPAGQQAPVQGHPLRLVRPHGVGHRRPAEGAELQQSVDAGRRQGLRPHRRGHLAPADLAVVASGSRQPTRSPDDRPARSGRGGRVMIGP